MATATHQSRSEKTYAPLGQYLARLPALTREVTLTFTEVEKIIGRGLPPSARKRREWWANQDYGSRAYHWQDAGFRTGPVSMTRETVRFSRNKLPPQKIPRSLTLQEVVSEVNEAARARPIGTLQQWRKQHSGKERTGASDLFFSKIKRNRNWVFHAGGLMELQFNLGFEDADDAPRFRHGVAFSLQPTQAMPDVSVMKPKIARFNAYLRANPKAFEGFQMWHWDGGRSPNYDVSPIPPQAIHAGNFIFIGTLQPAERISIDWILDDFDRLLPLYQYIEGKGALPQIKVGRTRKGFAWTPGNKAKVARTMYERKATSISKDLRHNAIQEALFDHLEELHGKQDTSGEQDCGNRTLVDVAVRDGTKFFYYELKTAPTAQLCIREAIGQLLEYSFWPGSQQAAQLVVVGEPPRDKDAAAYIKRLRKLFSLPIEYRQFDMKSKRLIEP